MMSIAYFSVKMAPCSCLGYNTDIRNKSFDRALPLCSKITFVFLIHFTHYGKYLPFIYSNFILREKKINRTFDSSDLKKLSTMDVAYNVYSIRKPNDLFEFLILPVDL